MADKYGIQSNDYGEISAPPMEEENDSSPFDFGGLADGIVSILGIFSGTGADATVQNTSDSTAQLTAAPSTTASTTQQYLLIGIGIIGAIIIIYLGYRAATK